MRRALSAWLSAVTRRAFDVAVAATVLVLVSPVMIAALAAIRWQSRGPALFRQTREGHQGRPFAMWKLRTMYLDADRLLAEHLDRDPEARVEWLRYFRLSNDPRVLPGVGAFLRRTSLDEVPQFWNVLRGEMSVIGPRPLPIDAVGTLRPELRALRNTVKPGITGLWQVSGRSDTDMRALEEIDATYVRSRSLSLDLDILLRTPRAVLSGRGAF